MDSWFEDLRAKRLDFLRAAAENDFERGIWQGAVDKYPDPAHFLLELLQNAEDQGATNTWLTIESERVVFEHDGAAFTRSDVENITGLGNTAKPSLANKIGCFGIGFKSVFIATERPEIYAEIDGKPFCFAIEQLVLPTKIAADKLRPGLTRFVLPIRREVRKSLAMNSRKLLEESGPRLLLFLRSVQSLDWTCGPFSNRFIREPGSDGLIEVAASTKEGRNERESLRYLTFDGTVELGEVGKKRVTIAYRMNAVGELVTEPHSRLFVFFQTHEETGLQFLVHGPFLLTDNRANIKRESVENDRISSALSSLAVESLYVLRRRRLLKGSFLAVLPNPADGLRPPWAQFGSDIIKEMSTKPLVPVASGGHALASMLRRGSLRLRRAVDDQALSLLSGVRGVRWSITPPLRNSREDRLLEAIGIEEWTVYDLVSALRAGLAGIGRGGVREWLRSLSDSKIQQLYLALAEASDPRYKQQVASLPVVRTDSGYHLKAADVYFPPEKAREEDLAIAKLALVKGGVLRGDSARSSGVRDFLHSIGTRDVSEESYVRALLERYYGPDAEPVMPPQHIEHVRRFVTFWQNVARIEAFHGYHFLLDAEDKESAPTELYLDVPYIATGLDRIYGDEGAVSGSLRKLSGRYSKAKLDGIAEFAVAVGVADVIPIRQRSIPEDHPSAADLFDGKLWRSRQRANVNVDFWVDDLSKILELHELSSSRNVWIAASRANLAKYYASYQSWPGSEMRTFPSKFAHDLASFAWIPSKDGGFYRPQEITYADLPDGFDVDSDSEWLDAIGFGANERERSEERLANVAAARQIGIPDKLSHELMELSESERQQVYEEFERVVRERKAGSIAAVIASFPERESADPERRAQRLAENASKLGRKRSERRERTVRIRDAAIDEGTKEYLRGLYTNDDGQLVCQICRKEMPFRLPSGKYYFEAVECVPEFAFECRENHLALCPTCAAKYLYANGTDFESLRVTVMERRDYVYPLTLAELDESVRFVADHLNDLATIFATVISESA